MYKRILIILMDHSRLEPDGPIVPHPLKNLRGVAPDPAPRTSGRFASSPWQRHGTTVPKKLSR
jgi:hypothetical protein